MTALQVAIMQACGQMTLCMLCSAFWADKSFFHVLKKKNKQIHSINGLHAPPAYLSVSKAMYSPVQMHHCGVSKQTAACSQLCQRKATAYWMAEEIISKPLPVASAFRKMASASPVTSTQNSHVQPWQKACRQLEQYYFQKNVPPPKAQPARWSIFVTGYHQTIRTAEAQPKLPS